MVDEEISFEDIWASLDKDTASMLRLGSQFSKKVVPTASYKLNRLLGGGLRKGKQHTFWGREQSAKTAFTLQTVGINQKLGEKVAWIDAEHSYDEDWAYRLGVDPDRLAVSSISTIAELTDLQVKLINKGFDIIVIDSTGALMPKSFIDKDGQIKPFGETAQLGAVAKDLGQMCKMVQGVNYSTCIIHISQARIDVGASSLVKPYKAIGGFEVEHTDSLKIRFSAGKTDKQAIMGKVQRGNLLVEEKVGIHGTWHVDKNKINGRYGVGDYDFYTGGDFVGLDFAGELLDEAISYGFAEASGAWVTVLGDKYNGRTKATAALRENPALLEKLRSELDAVSV
jgi:recombination protein RecA